MCIRDSGTAAAAAGGFTAIACMPNTEPVVDTPELVQYLLERAETVGSGVRVLPIAAVTACLLYTSTHR